MKEETAQYFKQIKHPKNVKIIVGEEITLTTSNTNFFTIGFFVVLIAICITISVSFSNLFMAIVAVTLTLMTISNLFSKTVIKLSDQTLEVKDSLFNKVTLKVNDIESVYFTGKQKNITLTPVFNAVQVADACTHIKLKSGKVYQIAKKCENQKLLFRCIELFLEFSNKNHR